MALNSDQRNTLRRAIAAARRRNASPRELKALITASAVESNHQHARYARVGSGDRDSVGFLQQRPSQGWGPAGESVEKDTAQFLAHAKRLNRSGFKGSAGQLAQAVQRSAFPERYDQRGAEAERLIRQFGGSGGGGDAPSQDSGKTTQTKTTVTGAGFDPGAGPGTAMLAQLAQAQARPQAPVSIPSPPQFAAQASMPGGYQPPSAPPVPQERSGLADALAQVTSSGNSIPQVDVKTETSTSRGGGGNASEGGKTPGKGRLSGRPYGGYQGSQGPGMQLAKIGTGLGLEITNTKRHNTNPYSGKNSDHDHGNKNAWAADLSNGNQPTPEMDRAALRMARALGIKDYKMGQPINRKVDVGQLRFQLIYRGAGPAFGGNHMNHVHIGVRRIR